MCIGRWTLDTLGSPRKWQTPGVTALHSRAPHTWVWTRQDDDDGGGADDDDDDDDDNHDDDDDDDDHDRNDDDDDGHDDATRTYLEKQPVWDLRAEIIFLISILDLLI